MHAMHVGAKIVHVYVPLKRRRAELHIDTKNKTKRAKMTDAEISSFWPRVADGIFEFGANL